MRSWLTTLLLLGLMLGVPTAGAHGDFTLNRGADGWEFDSPGDRVQAEAVVEEPGEHYQWKLTAQEGLERLEGEITVPVGYFDVERRRQVVPETGEGLFVEVNDPGLVDEGENPGRLLNITSEGDGDFVYHLSFPVQAATGEAELSLRRDVTPPQTTVGPVQNVTHRSFYVETNTSEPAWGVLWVRPADAPPEDAVEHRTQTPSFLQRFPIVGLRPATEYVFHVETRDWAGNEAPSESHNLTTEQRVVGPSPQILSVRPEPDAVLNGPPEAIEADYDAVAGGFGPRGVRLFVDLEEVTNQATIEGDSLRYVPPEPLEPGLHAVRLELENTENGEAFERWEFTVQENAESPAPWAVVLLLGAIVGMSLRRRSRRTP